MGKEHSSFTVVKAHKNLRRKATRALDGASLRKTPQETLEKYQITPVFPCDEPANIPVREKLVQLISLFREIIELETVSMHLGLSLIHF